MKFTFEQLKEEVRDGRDVEVDGVLFEYVEEIEDGMDDNGMYATHVYKRTSDGKFFSVELYWIRYGYEDYGFERDYNDGELEEVVPKEITIRKWVRA